MSGYYGAGRLDKAAQVLELQKTSENTWEWVAVREIRLSAEFTHKINIFSKVGTGARDAELVTWRRDITLHNAIRLDGLHLFLTGITDRNRNQMNIRAAICEPTKMTAKPHARTGLNEMNRPVVEKQAEFTFTGILTEVYHRNESDEVFRSETLQRALVTGKPIVLRVGDLVQVGGEKPYVVRQVMDLDPYKNEYIVERKEDV